MVNECLANLKSRGFKGVTTEIAKAGDLFIFDGEGDVGHCTIIRSRTVATTATVNKWAASHPAERDFLKQGEVHAIEIDASWGGGVGVARKQFLYNARTKDWIELAPNGTVRFYEARPYHHKIDGIYRPTGE